jgi:four helix bundle protein
MGASSFRDLRVWQQAMELALSVYRNKNAFPRHELYGLAQQMRRAAVSFASNVAEGKGRKSGSLLELETQILIAAKLEYLSVAQWGELQTLATQVRRSLAGLLNSLQRLCSLGLCRRPRADDRRRFYV